MKLYLAADSSLELIRYLRSVNGNDGLEGTITRGRTLKDAMGSMHEIEELDSAAQLWLDHISRPIHACVCDRSQQTHTQQLVTRVFSQDVPYGAFLNLGHGVCICSPFFTFMLLAKMLDTAHLLQVGMELCGTYSSYRLAPAFRLGLPHPNFDESGNYTYDLPPAMNAQLIDGFLERMKGYDGVHNATRDARWLLNGAASPMETATYLLLCLPRRLGGYGLPKPLLNPLLKVSNPDGVKKRYPDLFWPGPNIDVEYNSDAEHSGEWARYRDSRREVELTVASVRVLPLTRPQLMDVDSFDAFAQGLRRMLGIRSRTPDAEWAFRRAELRRTLLLNAPS